MCRLRLILVVALLSLFATDAVSVTLQDQVAGTQFVQSFQCNEDTNSMIVIIRNGFVTPSTLTIQLNYDGSISQTNPINLDPLATSGQVSVFPLTGGIGNRLGVISLIVQNPTYEGGASMAVASLQVACGAVVQSGVDQNCYYVDIGCLIDNGWCTRNFWCWSVFVYLPLAVLIGLSAILAWSVTRMSQGSAVIRARSTRSRRPGQPRGVQPMPTKTRPLPPPPAAPPSTFAPEDEQALIQADNERYRQFKAATSSDLGYDNPDSVYYGQEYN